MENNKRGEMVMPIMPIHKNYAEFEENNSEMVIHVNNMYKLINQYAKDNGIELAYDDRAEIFVEAIATYIVESKR